jgi:predicted CXXCH cytochrome family protein
VTIGEEGTTVGLAAAEPELCVMCHDSLEAAAVAELAGSHAPVADSCLNCHLPHAGEVQKLLVAPKIGLCAECHDLGELEAPHGGQITPHVDCTSCHSPHGSEHEVMLLTDEQHAPFADASCEACHREPFAGRIRMRARGDEVCAACHGDLKEEVGEGGVVHQALIGTRSRAGCVNCHDPHMSGEPQLLVDKRVQLCARCHKSVVEGATADTGHPPAAEDCVNCHSPHTSPNQKLLVETTPELCLMCHDVDDEDLSAAHLRADLPSLACTSCHSPHGEGNDHLLARTVHQAILDGCDTCHEGSSDQLIADGESELCLACHDDIGEAAEAAAVPHPAMEMARCADCHNPHASPQDKLLVAPGGGECTTCHDDKAPGENEVAHGIISLVGCRACHEPHGGAGEHLLRVTGSELCLSCHVSSRLDFDAKGTTATVLGKIEIPAAVARAMANLSLSAAGDEGHPIAGHRVLGTPTRSELDKVDTTFEGELTCLTCHDPHKGRSEQLLQWGAASAFEACGQCHPK